MFVCQFSQPVFSFEESLSLCARKPQRQQKIDFPNWPPLRHSFIGAHNNIRKLNLSLGRSKQERLEDFLGVVSLTFAQAFGNLGKRINSGIDCFVYSKYICRA